MKSFDESLWIRVLCEKFEEVERRFVFAKKMISGEPCRRKPNAPKNLQTFATGSNPFG
jgi:hypothetical protein